MFDNVILKTKCPNCSGPMPLKGSAFSTSGVHVCSVWCAKMWNRQEKAINALRIAGNLVLALVSPAKGLSCAGECTGRTDFWRTVAWVLGDEHANRICRLIDIYCRAHGIDPARFHRMPPH